MTRRAKSRSSLLLVPDIGALERKLADPPPLLARCYERFRQRLVADGEFRSHHVFLPALLGDPAAIVEAKGQVTALALNPLILANARPGARSAADTLDNHIWCVAPRAMRLAAYFNWLDARDAWTPDERRLIGTGLLDFFHSYVVPVLRARVPGGHNQQLSMTFCSAFVGHAFSEVEGVAHRAGALRDWALPKLRQVLGMMPASGYSGEGTTYQSDVVAALSMWAGLFLEQMGERDVWYRRWEPGGWRIADTLRMEELMASGGGLLPPWDHYGWQRLHNLAARAVWAGISGRPFVLDVAEAAWDEPHHIAWRPDDRLWTLIYWPDSERRASDGERRTAGSDRSSPGREGAGKERLPERAVLSGWSIQAVGAAVEHLPRKLRVMTVWDRCAGGVQGLCRAQVNPNHLIVDLGGEPVTADGWMTQDDLIFGQTAVSRTLDSLLPVELEMISRQCTSVDTWFRQSQYGFLGASCAIVVDGWESYFPREPREGRLVFEKRTAERHTFAGEAAAYYQPAFDITRMRRTVSMSPAGITWILDDLRAQTPHGFTWRIWLRRGTRSVGPLGVRLDLPSGAGMTFAWLAEAEGSASADSAVSVITVPTFPRGVPGSPWPEQGSDRCDIQATGNSVLFAACMVPEGVEGLTVRRIGDRLFEAVWDGGSDRFEAPVEISALPDLAPATLGSTCGEYGVCDLDETPFGLPDDAPVAELLAALDNPPPKEWRRTGAAMQTLAVLGNAEAMPRIVALLLDAGQNYTVHSVAAWCLGRARYAPALDALRRMMHIPEVNTAARAGWAVDRISGVWGAATAGTGSAGTAAAAALRK